MKSGFEEQMLKHDTPRYLDVEQPLTVTMKKNRPFLLGLSASLFWLGSMALSYYQNTIMVLFHMYSLAVLVFVIGLCGVGTLCLRYLVISYTTLHSEHCKNLEEQNTLTGLIFGFSVVFSMFVLGFGFHNIKDDYGRPRIFEGFDFYDAQQLEKSGAVVSLNVPYAVQKDITAWLMPDGTAEIESKANCVNTKTTTCPPPEPTVTVSTVWHHVGQNITIGDCPEAFSVLLNRDSGVLYHGLAPVGRITSFVDTDKRAVNRWLGQEKKPNATKASCGTLQELGSPTIKK